MDRTNEIPESFELVVEHWLKSARQWARATAQHPEGDPHPVILLATPKGPITAGVNPGVCNDSAAKDLLFLNVLPALAAEHGAHTVGWFSAIWHTESPAHIKGGTPEGEAYQRELDEYRERHGSIAGHRDTREGISLVAADGESFASYLAETRRHRHKAPTFSPWRGEVIPFEKQLSGDRHGGRIALGMALALALAGEVTG